MIVRSFLNEKGKDILPEYISDVTRVLIFAWHLLLHSVQFPVQMEFYTESSAVKTI